VSTAEHSENLPWRVSSSLESSRPGEVLMLDNEGHVVDARTLRQAAVRGWTAVVGVTAATATAIGVLLASPIVGVLSAGTVLGLTLWQSRHGRAIRRALVLASAGRRDQAREVVAGLEQRRLPPPFQPLVDYLAGKLEWQRGGLEAALARLSRVDSRLRTAGRHEQRGLYWLAMFDRAQLLAVMDRLPEARQLRAELEQAPRGEYFALELALTDLLIAFHANTPGDLPQDEQLYDWARSALGTTRFGAMVVALAWAFERRGEDEMAALCLREAPVHLETEFLAESAPKLSAWYEERRGQLPEEEL
jgi:hypothetical protein